MDIPENHYGLQNGSGQRLPRSSKAAFSETPGRHEAWCICTRRSVVRVVNLHNETIRSAVKICENYMFEGIDRLRWFSPKTWLAGHFIWQALLQGDLTSSNQATSDHRNGTRCRNPEKRLELYKSPSNCNDPVCVWQAFACVWPHSLQLSVSVNDLVAILVS